MIRWTLILLFIWWGLDVIEKFGVGHVGTIHVIKKHYWTEEVRDIISRNKRLYKTYFKTNDARDLLYFCGRAQTVGPSQLINISVKIWRDDQYSGVHPSGIFIYEESGTMCCRY
jgi:hypothetical protein